MTPGNGAMTVEQFERDRLAHLAAQSDAEDVVFVELVYRGKWVRFDLSAMQAQYLTAEALVARYLSPALAAVSLPRDAAGSSASETSSSEGV